MTLIEWLDHLDKTAFVFIHHDFNYRLLDKAFLLIRNQFTWIPLYGFILYIALTKFKKSAILFIALSILTFALCDSLSASWLKPLIGRLRPCYNPELQPMINNLIECGGKFSFPSTHASNHFGLASFWYWSVFHASGKRWNWLWLWAFLVGYAQIYVGKHYPLDIAGGALLGLIIGTLLAKIFENWTSIRASVRKKFFPNKPLET